jgi:hypothetical protein
VGEKPVWIDLAHHGQAELWLPILDTVPTDHQPTAGRSLPSPALQDRLQHLPGQFIGPTQDVESHQGPTPHGVDVAHRVGGGNLTPHQGVVHHRCDEVDGEYQGSVGRDTPDGGVVAVVGPYQKVGVAGSAEGEQNLLQLAGSELAGSARPVTELDQASVQICHSPQPRALLAGQVIPRDFPGNPKI